MSEDKDSKLLMPNGSAMVTNRDLIHPEIIIAIGAALLLERHEGIGPYGYLSYTRRRAHSQKQKVKVTVRRSANKCKKP